MPWTRIKNPDQALLDRLMSASCRPRCPDCGVTKGKMHMPGCDVARCARCGGQLLACGCQGPGKNANTLWDGLWPGSQEAYDWRLVVEMDGKPSFDYNTVSVIMQSDEPHFLHRKGGIYVVQGVCIIEKTCEPGVLYQGEECVSYKWCRPISEFLDGRFTPMGKTALVKVEELKEYAELVKSSFAKEGVVA